MAIRRKRISCWTPKATNVHSESVIRIAFPLQQWFHGRTPMLRYTYIACLVVTVPGAALGPIQPPYPICT